MRRRALAFALTALAAGAASAPAAVAQQPAGCGAWPARTVQTGLGRLESVSRTTKCRRYVDRRGYRTCAPRR